MSLNVFISRSSVQLSTGNTAVAKSDHEKKNGNGNNKTSIFAALYKLSVGIMNCVNAP